MSLLTSLLAALELTGGEQVVLRSGERPHLIVGGLRHDLDTATVSTTAALEALADEILSPAGKQALAERNVALEPLAEQDSAMPIHVVVRRIGPEMRVELQRGAPPSESAAVDAPPMKILATIEVTLKLTPPESQVLQLEQPDRATSLPAVSQPQSESRPVPGSEQTVLDSISARLRSAAARTADMGLTPPPLKIAAVPSLLESEQVRGPRAAETPERIASGSKRPGDMGPLDYLIRLAARRSAAALYLRAGDPPMARIGDRMEPILADPLDDEAIDEMTAPLGPGDDGSRPASSDVSVREYEGVGQVRWHTFTDARGRGLVVYLAGQNLQAVLQRSIPRQVKQVCQQDDGIVLASAPAAADVLDLIAAVGSWTARRRAGYLISIEPPGGLGHDIAGAFVSARRVSEADHEVAAAIRRAAHETPDALVIPLTSGVEADEALRAASPGRVVVLGIVAPTATRALESLLALVTPQHELELRRVLAAWFRCAFSYRALRSRDGGWKVVHDLLIGTHAVRARLERWDRWDAGALEKLQRAGADGMRSLDAALASAVLTGDISLRQAATHAIDRPDVVRTIRQSVRDRRRHRRERIGVVRPAAGGSGKRQ